MPALAAQPKAAPGPQIGEVLKRSFVFERGKIDEKERTVELSFSSETPVERYWGVEILSHEKDACDLSFLNDGAPLLLEHDRYEQIGVIESAEVKDGKGRASVRFSRSPKGEEIFQDVRDGIRRKVSVSYEINEMELAGKKDGVESYRITRWHPIEISIVSIPADKAVGTDRSGEHTQNQNDPMFQNNLKFDPAAGGAGGGGGSGGAATLAGNPPATQTRAEISVEERNHIRKSERDRQKYIRAHGAKHKVSDEDVNRFIEDGTSCEDFAKWIVEERYEGKPTLLDPNIGMSPKEVKRYSIVRALRLLGNRHQLDGLELECSQEVAKRAKRDPQGFFIPHDITTRSLQDVHGLTTGDMMSLVASLQFQRAIQSRSLTAGVSSAGGYTVGTEVLSGSMIELLRNKALVVGLGARVLGGLQGDIAIPRHTGGATTYWLSETAQVTTSDQTFGQLALTPHRVVAATAFSKQLVAQSSIDIEAFVREDLMRVLAIEKDRAAINGVNAAGEPLGILNTTGIGSVTFGAAATWQKVIDFETAVANANADVGALAYLSTPSVRGKWKALVKVTNQAVFLWEKGMVNDYRAEVTKNVPGDKVIFGNWNDFIIGDWDGIDVVVDPLTLAKQGLIQIIITIMTDNGMRHVGSFAVSTDSGAQ